MKCTAKRSLTFVGVLSAIFVVVVTFRIEMLDSKPRRKPVFEHDFLRNREREKEPATGCIRADAADKERISWSGNARS